MRTERTEKGRDPVHGHEGDRRPGGRRRPPFSITSCGSERSGHSTASPRSSDVLLPRDPSFSPGSPLAVTREAWQAESALHAIRRQGGPEVCPTNGLLLASPYYIASRRCVFLLISLFVASMPPGSTPSRAHFPSVTLSYRAVFPLFDFSRNRFSIGPDIGKKLLVFYVSSNICVQFFICHFILSDVAPFN